MNIERIELIESLRGKGLFCDADVNFARFICRGAGPSAGYELYLAAALNPGSTPRRDLIIDASCCSHCQVR